MRTPAQIAAQVAVEHVANTYGDGFDRETMAAVLTNGEANGVSDLYLDMVREILA